MASYSSDAKTIFGANLLSVGTGLGVQACLAWFLLPEGRGQYAACILFATVLTLTCALGQEMANVYFIGSKRIGISEAMSQSLIIGVAGSAIACAIGYALTLTTLPFLDKAPVELFRLSLICIPATLFYLYLSRIFLGMSAITMFAVIAAAPRVIALLGLVVVRAFHLDVQSAIVIHACSEGAVALAAAMLLVLRHGARFNLPSFAQLLSSLGYGVRFHVGKLASMANVQMGSIVLAFSPVAAAELGLFAAASAIASRLWIIAETLQTALLPRTTADPDGRREAVAECVRLCLVVTAAAAAIGLVFSRPIIGLVLSPRFLPVIAAFQILLPGVVIRVVPKILAAYFAGIGRPGITSTAVATSVCLNVFLVCMLLPVWGLPGAALAMTVSYTVEALIICLAFRHVSGLPVGRLILVTPADIQTLWRIGRRALCSGIDRPDSESA